MKKNAGDITYQVQHFSFLRKRWATVGEYPSENYAIKQAETYDGVMRVLCCNTVAKVPVFACVRMKGILVKL